MTTMQRRLRNAYSPLLDPSATAFDAVHHETGRVSIEQLRRHLRAVYAADARLVRVLVRVADVDVGVSTRALVEQEAGTAGGIEAPVGAGERASQPGDSTRYRIVLFGCQGCAASAAQVFYDERRIPMCVEHGPMELIR